MNEFFNSFSTFLWNLSKIGEFSKKLQQNTRHLYNESKQGKQCLFALSEVRLHGNSICHVVTINCSNIAYKGMIGRNNALYNPVIALERAFAGVKIETRIFNFCHIDVSKWLKSNFWDINCYVCCFE